MNLISLTSIALLRPYCQTRPSNERTLRRCLKARVGMTKRGGACASLAERGRLRRPERGDYLSFVAHQTRAGGRRVERVPRAPSTSPGLFLPKAPARSRIVRAPVIIHHIGNSRSALLRLHLRVAHDRTHADFSAAASPFARKAWKRVITRECAYNISLEYKRRMRMTIGPFEMQIGMHAPLREGSRRPSRIALFLPLPFRTRDDRVSLIIKIRRD